MTTCTAAGCGGDIAADGYCNTCGAKADPPGASGVAPAPSIPSAPDLPEPVAPHGTPAAMVGRPCAESGCRGSVAADGYCDTCGARAATPIGGVAPGAPVPATPSIAAPSAPMGSARAGSSSRRTSRSARTGTSRTGLGLGLVEVAPTETGDPAEAVMSPADIESVLGEAPEDRRVCSACGRPVGRASGDRAGRVQGFCANCRTPFDFRTNAPALSSGEMVAGQYEILGPLAHGGMGWIYLGRDKAVSDRWVVLKGLLNDDDPDAAAAAVAERRFLAQIDHPNIVQIYNFVTHLGRGYIVMEYVGGDSLNGKLKARRRANGGTPDPLPVAEALAYVAAILPAFGYLHGLGLVYNDLKPANIMAVGDGVKLIDVGAVMRVDDADAAIFGTAGFQAPEVAAEGPSVASDLYTVGRTLAVLTLDFVFHTGPYETALPPAREAGVLATWESYHRFLLKATAFHPDDRFQSADEMAEQLTGVLREIVSVTQGVPKPSPSRLFGNDQLTALLVGDPALSVTEADWRALPEPKIDPADPAAAMLADLDDVDPATALGLFAEVDDPALVASPELRLRVVRATIVTGGDPRSLLDDLAASDPWDWRVEWYRSLFLLAQGDAVGAAEGFGRVWTETPGEIAPRLAAALASERAGEFARAASLYERVVSVEPTYVSAAFGLARCHAATGDHHEVVRAYAKVPASSATWQDAQVASARALVQSGVPGPDELATAAATVERLQLDAAERAALSTEILERALSGVRDGSIPAGGGITLFGHPLGERGLRRALDEGYRELARLSSDPAVKVAYVDRANAVRPRTLV